MKETDMTDEQPRDRTAELEARLAELERRTQSSMAQAGGRSGVEAAFWAVMHSVFPDEARRHLKAATREQLMAARVYLDRWIAQLDETSDEEAVRSRERIEIE
jgi:hypothetical protein